MYRQVEDDWRLASRSPASAQEFRGKLARAIISHAVKVCSDGIEQLNRHFETADPQEAARRPRLLAGDDDEEGAGVVKDETRDMMTSFALGVFIVQVAGLIPGLWADLWALAGEQSGAVGPRWTEHSLASADPPLREVQGNQARTRRERFRVLSVLICALVVGVAADSRDPSRPAMGTLTPRAPLMDDGRPDSDYGSLWWTWLARSINALEVPGQGFHSDSLAVIILTLMCGGWALSRRFPRPALTRLLQGLLADITTERHAESKLLVSLGAHMEDGMAGKLRELIQRILGSAAAHAPQGWQNIPNERAQVAQVHDDDRHAAGFGFGAGAWS